jgi:hypothetical protein
MKNLGNTGYKDVDIYIVSINYNKKTVFHSIGILLNAYIYIGYLNAKC